MGRAGFLRRLAGGQRVRTHASYFCICLTHAARPSSPFVVEGTPSSCFDAAVKHSKKTLETFSHCFGTRGKWSASRGTTRPSTAMLVAFLLRQMTDASP